MVYSSDIWGERPADAAPVDRSAPDTGVLPPLGHNGT